MYGLLVITSEQNVQKFYEKINIGAVTILDLLQDNE